MEHESEFKDGDPVRLKNSCQKGVVEGVFQNLTTGEVMIRVLLDSLEATRVVMYPTHVIEKVNSEV